LPRSYFSANELRATIRGRGLASATASGAAALGGISSRLLARISVCMAASLYGCAPATRRQRLPTIGEDRANGSGRPPRVRLNCEGTPGFRRRPAFFGASFLLLHPHFVLHKAAALTAYQEVTMAARRLMVFLSYVSEDQKFADCIAVRIANSFKRAVDLKYMSQFPLGVNFRNLIDQALDGADILLVIATGHEKLSHSFTGYEVGYFRKSQQTRKYIDDERRIERLIIPIAMLTEIPATLSDIEGIGIAEADRFLVNPNTARNNTTEGEDPFFDLLARIDQILDRLDPVERTVDQRSKDYADYRDESKSFYQDLVEVMSSLPLRKEIPKTKLTLRLPADFSSRDIELENGVMLACYGPTAGMFEKEQSEQWVPWSEFSMRIGLEEIALTWSDALLSLLTSSVIGDFANPDPLVFSFDQRKLFRLFVSKSTTFFDHTRELDIYVVEVLRYKDIGDPFTTYLAKAIAIALRYRSLFLEGSSPYGPVTVRFWKKEERKPLIKEMLRELRLLLMQSQEAGLGERRHIIALYGSDQNSVDSVLAMMKTWLDQKAELYKSVETLLTERNPTEATFDTFLKTLETFSTQTKAINISFTTAVLRRLAEVVKVG
jgi:hypothetical protein